MPPPSQIKLFHFTHVDHVASIARTGLLSDGKEPDLQHEAGDREIKARRRRQIIDASPGGVVADYVPFYFAPRSPMMYSISRGNVPTFTVHHHELVYLCTTMERLEELGLDIVVSDRNAAKAIALFSSERLEWSEHGFIDWPLMTAQMWNNDPQHPDRMERRMAECLVHDFLPWEAVLAVGVQNEAASDRVAAALDGISHQPPVRVRPDWYY